MKKIMIGILAVCLLSLQIMFASDHDDAAYAALHGAATAARRASANAGSSGFFPSPETLSEDVTRSLATLAAERDAAMAQVASLNAQLVEMAAARDVVDAGLNRIVEYVTDRGFSPDKAGFRKTMLSGISVEARVDVVLADVALLADALEERDREARAANASREIYEAIPRSAVLEKAIVTASAVVMARPAHAILAERAAKAAGGAGGSAAGARLK